MARQSALALLLLAAALVGCCYGFVVAPVQPRACAKASSSTLVMRAAGGRDGAPGPLLERGAVLQSLGLSGLALAVAAGVAPVRPAAANVGEGACVLWVGVCAMSNG